MWKISGSLNGLQFHSCRRLKWQFLCPKCALPERRIRKGPCYPFRMSQRTISEFVEEESLVEFQLFSTLDLDVVWLFEMNCQTKSQFSVNKDETEVTRDVLIVSSINGNSIIVFRENIVLNFICSIIDGHAVTVLLCPHICNHKIVEIHMTL